MDTQSSQRHRLSRLRNAMAQGDGRLPPSRMDEGAEGVRADLESLSFFHRMHDGRVNIPDVFRVGYGLGRRERRFQGAELIRLVNAGTGASHRVLQRLASCGLVRAETVGRQKFYQANPAAPIYDELVALVRKTVGLREPLRQALAPLADDIECAFVFGSVAAGNDCANSDIDLIVVAHSLDYVALINALQAAEQVLDRPVNPNIVSPAEWARKREKDGFIARVAAGPRLPVLGGEADDGPAA